MKTITIALLLACLGHAALADDLATATPTPTLVINPLARRGDIRRAERYNRRSERQTAVANRAKDRSQQRIDRVAAQTAQAQARQAARSREEAQREVAAENRRQTHAEKPRLTSDLMTRMGFNDRQIADQKAREQTGGTVPKEAASPTPAP
ncbi:MAG: hypothetical protein ABI016_06815 [Chthoniobacterales bacterium]